ncbi:hypothetical protein DL96DRAFT_416128 [Flagelloscypha sp. PMI_526]|nr:hypothetical protein DL96DRAFT_416128 [Flagelloscypha sp. PMI_526]
MVAHRIALHRIRHSASFSINRKVKQTIMTSVNAEEQMNALLYTSEELDSKSQHTLTANWESGPPLCVDYFLVTPVSDASVSPSSTPTTAAKKLAPAAIGGIAAGGFALLLLVLLGVFLLRKRRRTQKRKPDDFEIESYPASGVVPMGSTYGQASSPSIQPTAQHTTRPSVSDASAIGAAFYLPSESGHSLAYLADHGNSSSHQLLAPEPPSYSSVPPMPVSRTGKGGT